MRIATRTRVGSRPRAKIAIEARGEDGVIESQETIEVLHTTDLDRQHGQLVRAVTERFPDGHIFRATAGSVMYVCRTTVVTATYNEPEAAPAAATRAAA